MSLDVPERQVLVYFIGDQVPYHHRVLIAQVEGSRWIVLTPDFELEAVDLSTYSLRAVARATPFPTGIGQIYSFDVPIDATDLAQARVEGRQLAEVLGGAAKPADVVGDSHGTWRYSDTAHEKFGQEVPQASLQDASRYIVKDAIALVQGGIGDSWTVMERVSDDDLIEWFDCKRTGAGRDRRLLPTTRTVDGARQTRLLDALPHMKKDRDSQPSGWPLDGPGVADEFLTGVVSTGHELLTHGDQLIVQLGVASRGALASEYRVLMTCLHFLVVYDQLNILNLAGSEFLLRRARMLQKAAQRNARAPDYEGLEMYLSHRLDVHGGVTTAAFDRHVAEEQRTLGTALKQSRLWREEREAEKKKQGGGGGDGGDGGG